MWKETASGQRGTEGAILGRNRSPCDRKLDGLMLLVAAWFEDYFVNIFKTLKILNILKILKILKIF